MYTNSINWFEVLQTNGCRLTTARRAVIEMMNANWLQVFGLCSTCRFIS